MSTDLDQSTVALVESPAQLLNVMEWWQVSGTSSQRFAVVVLAPRQEVSRLQLRRMAGLAREVGLAVQWHEPRLGGASTARTVRSLAAVLSGVHRLILGDPFSGVMQVVLNISRPREVVIVDDGSATVEFARQHEAGEDLARWHRRGRSDARGQVLDFARGQLGSSARRRLAHGSGCQLTLFTSMPLQLAAVSVVRNDFAWVRGRFPAPTVKKCGDLIGTSLVETGVVDLDHYVAGVRSLADQHSIDRYFAHRKEDPAKLATIARHGLEIVSPDLPLEIVARRDSIGRSVISFPSTVVHTLPLVLSDTAARLSVCDIADDWYTQEAPPRWQQFLGQVSTSARTSHGLLSVAC